MCPRVLIYSRLNVIWSYLRFTCILAHLSTPYVYSKLMRVDFVYLFSLHQRREFKGKTNVCKNYLYITTPHVSSRLRRDDICTFLVYIKGERFKSITNTYKILSRFLVHLFCGIKVRSHITCAPLITLPEHYCRSCAS